MFARRRAGRPTTAPAAPPVLPNTHVEAVLVADPDTASIDRERALRAMTGRQMQGVNGLVVGYDRGAPEMSFTGVVEGLPQPANAIASIGRQPDLLPGSEIYDQATTDPDLTAYQQALFARIAR